MLQFVILRQVKSKSCHEYHPFPTPEAIICLQALRQNTLIHIALRNRVIQLTNALAFQLVVCCLALRGGAIFRGCVA